jgi:hypothetical protein
MMSEVIQLDERRKPKSDVIHRDRVLHVLGREFTVRHTTWHGTGHGWFTVRDDAGSVIFVKLANFPEALIPDLISV